MKKQTQRPLALLLTIIIAFSSFVSTGAVANAAGVQQTLVSWELKDSNVPVLIPATSGVKATDNNYLTNNTGKPWEKYSGGSLNASGWDKGQDSKYWEISLSSKGFDSLKLSAQTRSSNTGPRDWKVQYSINGVSFKDVDKSTYKISDGKVDNYGKPITTLSNWMSDLTLPAEASNQDTLKLRLIMTSNNALNTGEVANGGVAGINNVFVYGTPITDASVVNGVVADPVSGSSVALRQEISLSCETTDAVIKYKINGGQEQIYDSTKKLKLDEFPATIVAYATKEGMSNSASTTFQYTQAKVDAVTAKPNGGSLKAGDFITLNCTTENSKITYSIDDGATWQDYTGKFAVTKLPAKVLAKASAQGMLDSVQTSFSFSERVNENYNVYFGQLHSHTNNSDGIGSVQDAFDYASKVNGLDFLAVTDHSNSLEDTAGTANLEDGSSSKKWLYGKTSAKEITEKKIQKGDHTFLGIYGFEMTWSNGIGHINTFNTQGFENRNSAPYKTANALSNYYTRLVANPNSISQFNHPGTTFGDFNDFANYNPQIDKLITMIEVGNGEGPVRASGYFPSYEYYTRALDKGWHVAPTNNQDNHKGKWGDANTARSVILADTLSEDSLYDAMRNRRMYATEDNNLKIEYELNDEPMGTILESKPDDVKINVKLSDPDKEPIGKVDVIVNGGKVAASKTVISSDENISFQLPAAYSYYYIRVTQPDKDIAVTAPVWVGEVDKAGISKTSSNAALPVKGEELTITTKLYNNESVPMDVTSLEYSIDDKIINTSTDVGAVESLSTKDYSFKYTSEKAGACSVNVRLTAKINGVEKIFTDVLKLNFSDPKIVTKVLIDGTHKNDYVNGYYANNMGNFTAIAAAKQVQVRIEETKVTKEMLDQASLFIISAPAKKAGTANGVAYTAQAFEPEFIAMVKDYVANGGTVITCGLADYQDDKADPYTSSTQINDLLKEIGATATINSDEVLDDTNNGGQKYRVYPTKVNKASPYLQGVVDEQKYSFYSGCTVNPGENGTWLVKGHDTTYSINSKMTTGKYEHLNVPQTDGKAAYDETKAVKKQGDVCVLVQEKVGKGNVLVGGTVFMSDFEVKASMDNYNDLQYINYTIVNNILDSIKKQVTTTKIADVRKQPIGETFAVEGIVTAGTQAGNAFFDTIYIQDETGGINIFPINNGNIQVGQKVRVVGSVDQYLGDLELRVINAEIVDSAINPLSPAKITTQKAADYAANGGKLVQVQGKVTKVVLENNVVSYALIKDSSDVEARVFIDGYITSSKQLNKPLESFVQVDKTISAIGLVSYDPDGSRIRVRDRAEVKEVSEELENAKATINNLPDNPTSITNETKKAIQDAVTMVTNLSSADKIDLGADKIEKIDTLLEKATDGVVTKTIAVPKTDVITKTEDKMTAAPKVSGLLIAAGIKGTEATQTAVALKTEQMVPKLSGAVLALKLDLTVGNNLIHALQVPVTVTFNFPKSFMYNSNSNYNIHHQIDENTSEELPLTIEGVDGAYTGRFTTSSFSTFTVVDNHAVPVTGITINKSSMSLVRGTTDTLIATVKPDNATNQTVAWSSSNTSVATVDTTGKVTAVNAGTATITATTIDGKFTATCALTVTNVNSNSGNGGGIVPTVPSVTFISDTTNDLTVKDSYVIKITSKNNQIPTLVIGTSGVFTTQLIKTEGSDYYFKIVAIGEPGTKAGVYVNGEKLLVATVDLKASNVKSDTTQPFKIKLNSSYTFKITAVSKPTFVAGTSSVFKVEFVKTVGNDHFFKVTAIGKLGEACGFYINAQKNPVAVATISN